MTMDRVYNSHQQQAQQQPQHQLPFQQQQQHTQSATLLHQLRHPIQQHHHHQHHVPRQHSSSPPPAPVPPPPPPPLPPPPPASPSHRQHSENMMISMQPNQHIYRGNQYQQQQSMIDQQKHHRSHMTHEHSQQSVGTNVTQMLHRPHHLPPPPPPPPSASASSSAAAAQHSLVINDQVPLQQHVSHFMPPLMVAKHRAEDVSEIAPNNLMRNSLPTVPTRVLDVPAELAQRNSLQNNFYANTQFQYYQPTNLRRHPTHHNKYINQQHLDPNQISSQTAVNLTELQAQQLHQHQQYSQPPVASSAATQDNLIDQTNQDNYTEEVIQAILAAKDALEKPIEERDEHDILLIDNLCSLVHGFDAFPKSVRRALAAQTVLIVIDEKGKELIVHNEELDSFCVLIFGECEQLNETKSKTIRYYNVGDAFGVCEPTTDTIRFFGHMVTRCENCAFLCVKRDDFYTILTDPANYPSKETIRHRDRNGNVVCISQLNLNRKTTGPLWSYHIQSKPFKIVLPDGHVITKATEACLLTGLVDGYERMDPDYIDDFLLLFRVFMGWDQKDKEKRLPPGMIKLCLTLTQWLDHVDFRDKVVKIVLTWLSSYYHDFELNTEFSYLFFRLLESRLLHLAMNNQLHLLHVTLSSKSKIRHVTISRSSREQPLTFSIGGGYEKNCGIFVTQVHGSSFEETHQDSLLSYLSHNPHDKMNIGGPTIPPRLRSSVNNHFSHIEPSSNKLFAQLRPGDQILEVNGTNFSAIKLVEAQRRLDMSTHLSLTVKYNPSAYHEMRALPDGRRKSSMSSLSSVSPYPQISQQKFTFNLNEHNNKFSGDQYPPTSPLFSTNANFGFRSIIKNAPKNDRSRLFNLINSSKLLKQIGYSTTQTNIETLSKTSDNISDDQSNDVDMGKIKSSSDIHKAKDKQLESGLSNVVRADDLNTAAILENGTNAASQTLVNVLRVFNAANNDSRYLLIHEETTAREVVMVAVKEFGLSGTNPVNQASPGEKSISSLNWHLYEVSVVPESRTIKQKCLSEQTSRLAERASLCSRFYIKNTSQSSIGPTKLDMGDDSLVNEILKESTTNLTLTSLNATLLAVELTLADFDKFRSIEPQQFVYDTFFDCSDKEGQNNHISANGSISSHDSASLKSSSSDGQESSDSLHSLNKARSVPKIWMQEYHKFADISNREMFWVICEILNEKNIGRRVKIVKQFVRVADVCSQLRNYNSMFAIISGLGHSCVARLRRTFEKLKPKYKNQLEKMRSLFDPSKNMSNYRICLSQTQPPAIPLFPQIKKDLTFTKEGRSIFVRESNDLSDEDESGFSQDTIKRKSRCDLLTVKSATMNTINSLDANHHLLPMAQSRSASYANFNGGSHRAAASSDLDSILVNFAEIRQFTDRVRNVLYFSSVPYSNDLLTNTKDSQRTQAQIKKMHEEWQMRKRIRHYIGQTLDDSNVESSSPQASSQSSRTQSTDTLDQVDGQANKDACTKLTISYDERALYQKSLEVESEVHVRPQAPSEPRQQTMASVTSATVNSTQPMHLHLPPPQVAPILNIPNQLQPTAANSSPTLSKSSSLSSCSSFSHHLPNYHPVRGGSSLTSAVGRFGTESTESLRKLRALSENVDDSSSCNNSNSGSQNNGQGRLTTDGGLGGLTRNLVPSRIFPPKNGK